MLRFQVKNFKAMTQTEIDIAFRMVNKQGKSIRETAETLDRDPGTISRLINSNRKKVAKRGRPRTLEKKQVPPDPLLSKHAYE